MREIVLDTETTGLDPLKGHRVAEIGCVELFNHIATGRTWHTYLNPQRGMPSEATAVHGLTDEFLEKQPLFSEVVEQFLEFIGRDPLVIHNAAFDMGFLNAELGRHGYPLLPKDRAIDTVLMARKMFPGAPASLDALCKRFGVDLSGREFHGALLDARLLADVYLELRGGRQPDLVLAEEVAAAEVENVVLAQRNFRPPRPHAPTDEELANHEAFIEKMKDPLWRKIG